MFSQTFVNLIKLTKLGVVIQSDGIQTFQLLSAFIGKMF